MVDYNRLLTNFINESDGILEESEESILELEKDSSPEVIDKIFRAVHTIKGNSGLFDLPKIRELAHSMENSLNHYRNHPPDSIPESTIDLYLSTIDRLKTMIGRIQESNSMEIGDLVSQYKALGQAEESARQGETAKQSDNKSQSSTAESLEDSVQSSLGSATGTTPKDGNVSGLIPHPSQAEASKPGSPNENSQAAFPKNLKIPVQKKFIQDAQAENKYLSLVMLSPLAIPGVSGLQDLSRFVHEGKKNGILKLISHPELMPDWDALGSKDWKVFLLLCTAGEPKEALQSLGIQADSIRILYNPEPAQKKSGTRKINQGSTAKASATSDSSQKPNEVSEAPKDGSKDIAVSNSMTDTTRDANLKVSVRLIDDLINLAGEAVIARNELLQKIDATEDSNLSTSAKKIGTLFSKLQEGIMKTRLQELDSVFQKVPRIVRDISKTTGKNAELIQVGGEVELDKTLIDAISDPIMHMIRNSLDHGIESPEERANKGKSPQGMIRLAASLRGGNVIISIEDDGKGLDRDKIAHKIIEKGIMTREQVAEATDEQIFSTVFLPGFSTAEKVTTVSGRGVGMDVVRTNLKKVGGTAEIANRPGGGTIVTLTIPQTLSIVTTLLIRTAGRRYAVPEQNVKELILVNPKHLSKVETHLIYNLRDHLLPVLDLAKFLKLSIRDDYNPQYMAVLKSEKHTFGILIDEIINPEEIVVKSLGSLFTGLNIFSGATIMGDGETVLILDVPGMAKFWSMQANIDENELRTQQRMGLVGDGEEAADIEGYLLFSVGKQQFAVSVESVPRIEKIQRSEIRQFQDIEVVLYRETSVPLVHLDEHFKLEVKDKIDSNQIYAIFFKLHGKYTGILADSVEKVINEMPVLKTDTFVGDGIMGYVVLDGVHTLFLDINTLSEKLHREQFHDLEMIALEEGVA